MRQTDGIEVPAGKTVTLAPQGTHVMLMGLKAPLKEGTTIPLTLEFTQAGKITVQVDVAALGATLQTEGAAAFVKSWDELIGVIAGKLGAGG
jgi:copper(I)-binding protein